MPRSRNSRSSSPLKSLKTTTGQSEYDRIFQNVQEMFSDTVDADVIYFVLTECHWRSEEAIDNLLTIVEKSEAQPIKTKNKLQEIAEGVLGPLRHDGCQEHGHIHPGSSQVSAQTGATSQEEPNTLFQSSSPSPIDLQARGGIDQQVTNASSPRIEKGLNPVSSDAVLEWDFPRLSKDSPKDVKLDSVKQQKMKSEELKNESWRAIKAPTSRKSSNSPHQILENEYNSTKTGLTSAGQVKNGVSPSRPRLEMNRSFPVRLLSKSPDEIHERLSFPQPLHQSSSESVLSKNKVDVAQPESFELDETVISCLSEINQELLDETEKKTDKRLYRRSRSSSIRSQTSENESGGTGCSTPDPSHLRTSTPNNQPMTLPVIGLSVEAPEFVPRPKKTKTEEVAQSSSETVAVTTSAISSRPSSAPLKVETKSIPVPVSSPHQGISPVIRLESPRLAVVSPGSAISPPTNVSVPNSAHLTGSPMFITPKWQPVFPGMYSPQQPPPPLQPRIVPQQIPQQLPPQIPQQLPQHLPPNYRFSPPGTQFPPYSGVMYPVGARPVFRVAGLPPRLPQVPLPQGVPVVKEINDNMVAMATGQPIMVTREAVHHGHYPAGLEGIKSKSGDVQQSLDVCVETVRALSKAGKKVMVIVRGLPGSGKSTLARAIQFDGVVLSTDDYFMKGDMYEYDPDKLTEGHQWNRERAKEAIRLGTSPIVIDNTNTQKWEFKPYISMALNNNYHVEIMEPDTPWKFKPKELAKRTVHGVPEDQIERMLNRYEKNLTVAIVTNNKTKKPVTNGLNDSQVKYNSSSKENSLSPTMERKPVKSAKSEATRRSRSRGKSNKLRDLKSTRKIQNKLSASPVLGNSNVNDLQEWQISEGDKMWDRQTLSPNSVHSFESNNASLLDDWTTDDWNEVRMETTEDGISNNDGSVQNPSLIAPNSDLASITSSQNETNFYPLPSGISSMTSSKTASPIIEFNVLETYSQSNHNSDLNLASKLKEKTVYNTERKLLKEIEAELSEEVLGYVNEVMEGHSNMNPNDLSVEDRNRIEEELKALLQFYSIEDEEQRMKAEVLIGLKLNNTENEQEGFIIETGIAEETCYEQYYVEENGGLFMSNKSTAIYDENTVSQGAEGNNDSKDLTLLMQDSNTDRTVDVNLDLDNSLNKEVANILNGLNLDMEDKSMEKFEHTTAETTLNDHVIDSLMKVETEDNFTEHVVHPVQETKNKISEVNSKYNLEVNEGVKITEKADNISTLVEEEFQNIHQPQEFHNSLESVSSKNQTQESIYDIDSAVIRAETSDFVETDSLFENDSAIIAASMDSLEKDRYSLYNNDSAILAVSTEAVDTDSVYETDSAIIAASTDLGGTDIVVEDADVMKRLKATVEELKYWGQIETEEPEASAETVITEWDDYSQEIDDQWQNELSSVSVKAKPQRQKRQKNGSYSGMENGSSKLEANAELLRNLFSETEETFRDDNNKETSDNNTHLAAGLFEASKSKNCSYSVELITQCESKDLSSQSCYNNNNKISSNTSPSISGAGNTAHEDDGNVKLTNNLVCAQYADKGEMMDFVENQNIEFNNPSGNESEQPVLTSETDNSIFISDEEELLNGSPLSKANSEEPKTENSDDLIFVSDDDMEYLNTDLTVDGLQTVVIQEEVTADFTDRSESLNIEQDSLITNNGQESPIDVKTVLPDLNPPPIDCIIEEKEIVFNENCKSETGLSNEKVSTGSAGVIVNDMHGNLKTDAACSQTYSVVKENEMPDLKLSGTSNGHSVQNQPSPKKRKQSKNRLAAKLSKPFFDFAETEKFASNDWSTLLSPFDGNTVIKHSKTDKVVEKTNFKSVGTLTESGDFRVLNLCSSGENIDYVHKYALIKTRSRSIDMDDEQLAKCSVPSDKTSIRKIDKSTSTVDLEKEDDNENIQFLKTCFPNISEDELESVLLNCANNTEWALNLLLDWKYHLDYTDEEKEHFAREILKCARCPSPEMSDKNNDSLIESNPDSLLNLCFEKIEKENIAAREDLEKQLIQTGKERLDRIEDENITKIRMRRSTSLSESSFDTNRSGINASHSFEKVRRSISEPYQNLDSAFLSPASVFDEKEYLLKGLQTSADSFAHKISLKQHKVFDGASAAVEEKNSDDEWLCNNIDELSKLGTVTVKDSVTDTESGKTDKSQSHIDTEIITGTSSITDLAREEERFVNHVQENNISIIEEEKLSSTPEPIASSSVENLVVFSLSLDGSVITQLEHLFGPVGDNSITGHGDLEVPINFETARLLHQCVRNGLQDAGHAKYKQLKEDEEFARRLQEEQDLSDRRNENQTYQSPSKRLPNARRGQAVSFANTPLPIRREPVKPLTEIMEEEMSKQIAREELQKFLESEGGHAAIATRMKRQKLHESFPTIDATLLDQIFQANCYNLSETMETIQSSLSYQPVQTVMTREMEEKYDRQLIQSIKQQNTLDALDSFNSLSEDYEDVVDAEYQDYRGEATLQHKLRQECFAKAQAAYRKGMKQLASFYSQQGHLHTQKLKEANMRASEQILEDRHNDLETKMTLDLHGLHVDEAITALDRILPEKERERYKSHLIIITGRGRHSNHGIPRLRPAVLAYLQRHQYSFTELHPGAFRVTLKNR